MKYTCPFTKQEIKSIAQYMRYESIKRNITTDELRFLVLKETLPNLVNKTSLVDFYIKKNYSLPDFRREFGLDYKATLFLLKWFNIPIRTIKDAGNLFKQKRIDTNLRLYGVENVSSSSIIKERKKKTFIKNYGVDNIWKDPAYYKWLASYMIENYGSIRTGWAIWTKHQHSENAKKRWIKYSPAEREEKILKLIKGLHSGCRIGIEGMVNECLLEMGLDFVRNFYINRNQYDFYIKNYNLILEVNGDFWHANPKKYKPNDILPFPNSNGIMASELWKKDEIKRKKAIDNGYKLAYIWENEIRKTDNLHKLLLNILKQNED